MDFGLKEGMKGRVDVVVTNKDTAMAFGSGGVEVYATPMMIGLMENASLKAVDDALPEGYTTVGTHLNVKHLAPTPVGMGVYAQAQLIEINGKALTFKVEAFDGVEKIGEGTHQRYIIFLDKFLEKTNKKKERGI